MSALSPSICSSESGAILSSCGRNSIRSMSAISISLVIWKDLRLCLAEIGRIAELVAINAFSRYQGIASALLRSIVDRLDRLEGFETLRLTTTNDNLDALQFYQRRGFRLQALRPGAVEAARAHKPTISAVGEHGILIRDELDLTLQLRAPSSPLTVESGPSSLSD